LSPQSLSQKDSRRRAKRKGGSNFRRQEGARSKKRIVNVGHFPKVRLGGGAFDQLRKKKRSRVKEPFCRKRMWRDEDMG